MIALSNDPNIGVSHPSPADGNRSSFQIAVFFCVFQNTDDEQSPKPSNPQCHTPSAEAFRIYLNTVDVYHG
jgi:hypothetical protein